MDTYWIGFGVIAVVSMVIATYVDRKNKKKYGTTSEREIRKIRKDGDEES